MKEFSKILAQLLELVPQATKKLIYTWVVDAINRNDADQLSELLEILDRIPDNKKENSTGNSQKIIEALLTLDQSQLRPVLKFFAKRENTDTFCRGNNLIGRLVQESNDKEYKERILRCFDPISEIIITSVTVEEESGRPKAFKFSKENSEQNLAETFERCVNLAFGVLEKSSGFMKSLIFALCAELKDRKLPDFEPKALGLVANRFLAAILVDHGMRLSKALQGKIAQKDQEKIEKLPIWFLKILPIAIQRLGAPKDSKDGVIPEKMSTKIFSSQWRKELFSYVERLCHVEQQAQTTQPVVASAKYALTKEDVKIILETIPIITTNLQFDSKTEIPGQIIQLRDQIKIILFRLPSLLKKLNLQPLSHDDELAIEKRVEKYHNKDKKCEEKEDENVVKIYAQRLNALDKFCNALQHDIAELETKKSENETVFQQIVLPAIEKFKMTVSALPVVASMHTRAPSNGVRGRSHTIDGSQGFFAAPLVAASENGSTSQGKTLAIASSSSTVDAEKTPKPVVASEGAPAVAPTQLIKRSRAASTIKMNMPEGRALHGQHAMVSPREGKASPPLLNRNASVANLNYQPAKGMDSSSSSKTSVKSLRPSK